MSVWFNITFQVFFKTIFLVLFVFIMQICWTAGPQGPHKTTIRPWIELDFLVLTQKYKNAYCGSKSVFLGKKNMKLWRTKSVIS